jgi:beta-xylosidase
VWVLIIALATLLAACGGGSGATPTGQQGAARATATAPSVAAQAGTTATVSGATSQPEATATPAPTSAPTPGPGEFANPVYKDNFPDPFVLPVGKKYYAYATNGVGGNVQTLTSPDLVHWTPGPDAMPQLAPWVVPGKTWAPEVLRRKDGKYVLYYTAASAEKLVQCVGRAVSASPQGPFVDNSKQPLVCQVDQGGSIDPSPFRDTDGSLYLLWKNDGNCCGFPTYIYAQKLTPDGLRLTGKRTRLETEDAPWEGILVEAPTMWKHGGKYYLFYSANAFNSEFYATGYAACKGPYGPCKDAPENPILRSANGAAGPGHQTITRDDDGEEWIVYHAWPANAVGLEPPGRYMWIDQLLWKNGKPVVHGPTAAPQPLP